MSVCVLQKKCQNSQISSISICWKLLVSELIDIIIIDIYCDQIGWKSIKKWFDLFQWSSFVYDKRSLLGECIGIPDFFSW